MGRITVETLGAAGSAERPGRRRLRAERLLPDLRPRGVGRLLDTALDLFAKRFAACAGVAALIWFPAQILEHALFETADPAHTPLAIGIALFVEVVTLAFAAHLVFAELLGRDLTAASAVVAGLPRTPGLIVLGLVVGTLSAASWLCCFCTVVPIVPLLVLWVFAVVPSAYVLERTNVSRAVERGFQLARGGFWPWLGWFATANVMVLPLTGLAIGLDAPDARAEIQLVLPLGEVSYLLVAAALSSLFAGVASAYTAICKTVYYVDRRSRLEALDLFVRLDRAGGVQSTAGAVGFPSAGSSGSHGRVEVAR